MTFSLAPTFSVIIPAYNEALHIDDFVKELQAFCKNENVHAELICINDGSRDNTHEILQKLKSDSPEIKILSYKENQGQGFAFREALKVAQGTYVFWIPSDGEIPPLSLKPLLKEVSPNEIVVAYPENTWNERSLFRIFLSKTYQQILRFLFNLNLKYFNAVAIYPRKALQEISWGSNRFFFPAEILIRLFWKRQYQFKEIPFSLNQRSSGKSQAIKWIVLKDIFQNLFLLLKDKRKT